jgi:hypothetical protein
MYMSPVRIELPASTPRDLRDEFVGLLEQLGPVYRPGVKSFDLQTAAFVLTAVSATADLLAIVTMLMQWRDRARRRSVPLDKVTIVAGGQSIELQDIDTQTLIRLLEGLRAEQL